MREALRAAAAARSRLATAPNPCVGAVLVKNGRVLARGATRGLEEHAETIALRRAGTAARGATLYVTLEPCAHHGRTGPCVEAVIAARPARVVIGLIDPDPRTRGRSAAKLARAGIAVTRGVLGDDCARAHEGFVSRVVSGRPFTTLKLAASLDGRIATRTGESRWITSEPARAFVHRLRVRSDAIAIGSGTLLADDPELTARRASRTIARPLRVVIDSKLRTPPGARLLDPRRPGEVLIFCGGAPAKRRAALERAGAAVVPLRTRRGRIALADAWQHLAERGVNDLLVEGGGGLAAALLRERLVDRMHFFLAPLLIGSDGRAVLADLGVERLRDALRPARFSVRRLGPDVHCTAEW